jgi:hypothetical protein
MDKKILNLEKRLYKRILKKVKEDKSEKVSIYKKIGIGMLALWISLAMSAINLQNNEINFLHKYVLARCIVIFIFSMILLDLSKEELKVRILASLAIVAFYYLIAEI